jgi:hypothetical protein
MLFASDPKIMKLRDYYFISVFYYAFLLNCFFYYLVNKIINGGFEFGNWKYGQLGWEIKDFV